MDSSSTGSPVPVAPGLNTVEPFRVPRPQQRTGRVVRISALAVGVAVLSAFAAQVLTALIGLITNLSFYGRWSLAFTSPADNHLGPAVIVVPVIGAVVIGLMARYGSPAIRGHGIPEAMEQVLLNESRISPRVMFLKPLSAAIAMGTGCPFGAEGPIIATGGALGSVVGQLFHISAEERKVLLAAGAAAGMAATFGSPVSAVLLAVELLLFEYRARSLIPVALAFVGRHRGATRLRRFDPDLRHARGFSSGRRRAGQLCRARRAHRPGFGRRHARRCTRSRRGSSAFPSIGCGGRRSAPSWSA